MTKQTGPKEALRLAIDKLTSIDLNDRCPMLGLNPPEPGVMEVRMFGRDYRLHLADFRLVFAEDGSPAKINDQVLLLHYLLCDVPVKVTGTLITLRDLPGGQFYWEPFLARTIKPLCQAIGNNIEQLKSNLIRFDWEKVDLGDFAARIHALGNIRVTLVYSLGDEEFPPAANLLFDTCIKRPFAAEDVVVLSSRICLDIIR